MSEGMKETELGELPEEWEVVRLGDIAEYINGYPFKPSQWKYKGLPIIRIQNLTNSSDKINYFDGQIDKKFKVKSGDLLISWSASLGIFKWKGLDAWLNQHIFKVDYYSPNVFKEYFYYAIQPRIQSMIEKTHGSTMHHITKKEFLNIPLSLPPLPEQKKIAAVLCIIQEAREKTERVIAALRELKKSLMRHLLTYGPVSPREAAGVKLKETEIGMMPEKWEVVKLGDVFNFSKKSRQTDISLFDKIPFVPMENIPYDSVFLSAYELKKPKEISSGTFFSKGDLLLAKITPSFENGKQCIVKDIPIDFGYATTEVWPIHSTSKADTLFLFYYLKIEDVRINLAGKMEGSTGRQRIPKNVLDSLLLPLPSIKLQKQIAAILFSIDERIGQELSKSQSLDTLFHSMLHHLMTGKVRVRDLDIPVEE